MWKQILNFTLTDFILFGVQYLMAHWTNIGGITVLVDKDRWRTHKEILDNALIHCDKYN